jgi:hypothetical protein
VGPRFGDLTQDRIVVAYVDQTSTNRIHVLASDDGGMTWNALGGTAAAPTPQVVSGTSSFDPVPAVGPNGEIYVVWEGFGTAGQSTVGFNASVDGGANWGGARVIYTGNLNLFVDPLVAGGTGRYKIPAQPGRGVMMGLSVEVDRSGGPRQGRIYVAFADQADQNSSPDTGTAAHDNLDIFVLASDDFTAGSSVPAASRGTNWNAHGGTGTMGSLRVSREPGAASQFLSWLDVDQSNGNVAVSWLDARNDTAGAPNTPNDQVEYFAAISIDGGQTWSANVPVSDGVSSKPPTDVIGSVDFLEYSGLAFLNGALYATWADRSNVTADNPDFAGTTPRDWPDVYFERTTSPGRCSRRPACPSGFRRDRARSPATARAEFQGRPRTAPSRSSCRTRPIRR